jgi:ABC-type transport system substrate-binding protein
MTRRQFLGGAASVAALGAFGLSGCGSSESSDTGSTEKVLNFAQTNAKKGLDEHVINDQLSYSLADCVAEAPLMWTEDLELVPCLLKEMPTVSDDGLTYSLTLKDGITCHDGSILKASDVKWSVERMLLPATGYKSLYMLNFIEGAPDVINGTTTDCSGIEVQDDTHLTIKLQYAYPTFMSILGSEFFMIYPEAAVEKVESAGGTWGTGTDLVGTGPYKLVQNDDQTKLVFEKFDQYHGDPVNIDKLDVRYIDDANTKMMSYVNGDIDLCDVDPSLLEQYQNDATVSKELHEYNPLGTYFINLNLSKESLQDVRVREAINHAINRQELVDTILHGAGTPASEYLNPSLSAHDDSLPVIEYDPDRSKSLLEEAGVSDLTLDCGVRSSEQAVAVACQDYLSKVGINLNVNILDSGVWTDRWRNGDLETTIFSWNMIFKDNYLAFYTLFHSSASSTKGSFYNNPEFDSLVEAGRSEED